MSSRRELHNIFINLTNFVFSLIGLLILLRFIFKLFEAHSTAPFVSWLYNTTDILISPFRGIFSSPIGSGGFVFDITSLVALVIYALAFSVLIYLFDLLFGVSINENS